jgi:hypothetical protein
MIGQTDAMMKTLVRVPRKGAAPRTRRPLWLALMLVVGLLAVGMVTASIVSASPVTLTARLQGGSGGVAIRGIASLDVVVDNTQSQICFTVGTEVFTGIKRVSLNFGSSAAGGTEVLELIIQQSTLAVPPFL